MIGHMEQRDTGSLRAALEPSALREALVPRRPMFGNPWDSTEDMFACCVAVTFVDPLLLWAGGALMSSIFGFDSHWPLGVYMAAAVVGAAGYITIVGRERTRLSVDVVAIGAWLLLGLVVAPVIGLGLPAGAAVAVYAALLVAIFVYVLFLGQWKTAFLHTVSWPITWTSMAVLFAYLAHRLILYQ
jgi:hypothetical protein